MQPFLCLGFAYLSSASHVVSPKCSMPQQCRWHTRLGGHVHRSSAYGSCSFCCSIIFPTVLAEQFSSGLHHRLFYPVFQNSAVPECYIPSQALLRWLLNVNISHNWTIPILLPVFCTWCFWQRWAFESCGGSPHASCCSVPQSGFSLGYWSRSDFHC